MTKQEQNTGVFDNTMYRINNQQANIYTLYCGIAHCSNLLRQAATLNFIFHSELESAF